MFEIMYIQIYFKNGLKQIFFIFYLLDYNLLIFGVLAKAPTTSVLKFKVL
jgi:hypothetical protein